MVVGACAIAASSTILTRKRKRGSGLSPSLALRDSFEGGTSELATPANRLWGLAAARGCEACPTRRLTRWRFGFVSPWPPWLSVWRCWPASATTWPWTSHYSSAESSASDTMAAATAPPKTCGSQADFKPAAGYERTPAGRSHRSGGADWRLMADLKNSDPALAHVRKQTKPRPQRRARRHREAERLKQESTAADGRRDDPRARTAVAGEQETGLSRVRKRLLCKHQLVQTPHPPPSPGGERGVQATVPLSPQPSSLSMETLTSARPCCLSRRCGAESMPVCRPPRLRPENQASPAPRRPRRPRLRRLGGNSRRGIRQRH